jgi:hypothetical protein
MTTCHRIRLIHWNAIEAEVRAAKLQAAGYAVTYGPINPAAIRELRDDPPSAVLIDLTRLPSQGRDLGLLFRKYATTRHVPLVFVEGEPAKIARVKALLPDAVYTTWGQIRGALKQAIAHPLEQVAVPESTFAAYAGVPLVKKLGLKANGTVALVNAPKGFERTLGELPEGVMFHRYSRNVQSGCDLILWFTTSRADLERHIEPIRERVGQDGLWIIWPKKASGVATDLTQVVVRQVGLASGLVDYKVCSIDATWTGLRFALRNAKPRAVSQA